MPTLLFNLRHVPEDEADDVRALLEQHGFETYETQPSPFGISAGAIWLKDSTQRDPAKRVIDAYQAERAQRVREERDAAQRDGSAPSLIAALLARPGTTLLLLLAIAAALAISAWPFFWMTR